MEREAVSVYYPSALGILKLTQEKDAITEIGLARLARFAPGDASESQPQTGTPLLEKAYAEICEFLDGRRRDFDLPLAPHGTPFQLAVWAALQTIPYGEVRSYQDIAVAIGRPRATRAVGGACHNNPILLMIPCHRVIGKNGTLVGFGGGVELKEKLLSLEKSNFALQHS